MVVIDRNMMLTFDEYMALRRLLDSEKESEGSKLANRMESKPKRRKSAYARKYKKAFAKVSKKFKLKNGSWRKGGFDRAVKEAHKLAKKMK